MTSTNQVAIQNALNPIYPLEPARDECCGTNQIYQSLPPTNSDVPQEWEVVAFKPNVKHLYTGEANWYPYQTIRRPVNTLYGRDLSQFHRTGVGRGKRISYTYKPYPLTDRNVRETRDYADYILPYMDFREWTKYPVQRDQSLNSDLQQYPKARVPDGWE